MNTPERELLDEALLGTGHRYTRELIEQATVEVERLREERDRLAEALRRIADGAEINPPYLVARLAREALSVREDGT